MKPFALKAYRAIKIGLQYKLSLGVLVVATITLLLSYLSLMETFAFFERAETRRQIYSNFYTFEHLALRLKMEETVLYALVQTPNEDAFKVFRSYQAELEKKLVVFEKLPLQLPDSKKRLLEIRSLIDNRRAKLNVALYANKKDALSIIRDLQKDSADENRLAALSESLSEDYKKLTENGVRDQKNLVSFYAFALSVSGGFALFLTLLTFLGARRDQRQRLLVERDLYESNERLSSVLEAQQSVSTSELNIANLKSLIAAIATQITGASGAIIEILEDDSLRMDQVTGPVSSFVGTKFKVDGSLSGLAMQMNQHLISLDCRSDERLVNEGCGNMGIRSLIAVPLRRSGTSFGVLKVYSLSPRAFKEQDGKVLNLIAGLMGSALIQATEYERVGQTLHSLRQSEDRLKEQKEHAETANSTKSLFLANMSHEIRTPLNAIIGLSHLLGKTPLTDQQRDYLYLIGVSGGSLLNIVNDILDFSKIEAGKLSLEAEDFDLFKLLSDVEGIVKQPMAKNRTTLQFDLDPDLRTTLKGDSGRLLQVFVNLVGNAIKFSPNGKVEVFVQSQTHQDGGISLHCGVRDNGMGMKPETLQSIFRPFHQGDNSSSRTHGGTGLGLSITKHLVTMMGGSISAESVLGQGSTFYFSVRLQKGNRPRIEQSPVVRSLPTNSEALRILVVDDNETNMLVTEETLRALGHLPDGVMSGTQALRRLESKAYDLILMDCNMPVMDGYETTKRIRENKNPNIAATPVIACTANAIKGDRERCLAADMDDYLAKPFAMADLARLLDKWGGTSLANVNLESGETPSSQEFDFEFLSRRFGFVAGEASRQALYAILSAYLKTMPTYLHDISEGFKNKNFKQIHNAAHSAKSSSGNIGAFSLKKQIDCIYVLTIEAPEDLKQQQIEELNAEYHKVSSKIQALLSLHAA